uniref:tRNA(Ile)-lysidine synthase, chloroplastic n=1 Tax=Ophidocladus simpliciusculus TaxID=1261574 RepID=A0A1Z1MIN9_9FLOR|nr:tRNA Ile-lysidine synthetase [Ophidocladus simpliciusculus]ARW65940.1 tRNA Ile-lysidine synthetase [Ophidocladus simpliciusculus]
MITNLDQSKLVRSILIAISGGQDSVYLIKLIENIRKNFISGESIKIMYIYIDHQWRYDSYEQIKHMTNYIKSIKQKISIYQIKDKIISEHRCRINRYHTIFYHAKQHKYEAIITAHTQTDKIETFLQNLIRGCGIEGATSLTRQGKFNKNIYFFRPLIGTTREHILWSCKKFCLPIWSDTTNYIYKIPRNRIRLELIPYIKKYFHITFEKNIIYLLANYSNDNEYIKQNTIRIYLTIINKKYISINRKEIKKHNLAIQFRIIQLFCFHNFLIYLDYKKLIKVIKSINKNLYTKIQQNIFIFHIYKNWIYVTLKH